ncbi:hypothetical protein D9M71_730240 [compost metagenome]
MNDFSVSRIRPGLRLLHIIEMPCTTMFITTTRCSVRRSSFTATGLNTRLASSTP